MTYPEDIMQAARELYITLAKTDFQTGILPKGEVACRSGEYDADQEMQIIAAAIATERARNTWQPIETAPRDGTRICLGWKCDNDERMQEWYYPMHWSATSTNDLSQPGVRGIWVCVGKKSGQIQFTWSEEDGSGPTHWAPQPPKGE